LPMATVPALPLRVWAHTMALASRGRQVEWKAISALGQVPDFVPEDRGEA